MYIENKYSKGKRQMATAEEKFKAMVLRNKQIILPLDESGITKEYYIWTLSDEDEEIWMVSLDDQIYGDFNDELIVDDYDLTLTSDFDEDPTDLILQMLDEPSSWSDVKYVEVKDDYPVGHEYHTDRMFMIREGEEMPKGFTGKFLVPDSLGGFKYEEEKK